MFSGDTINLATRMLALKHVHLKGLDWCRPAINYEAGMWHEGARFSLCHFFGIEFNALVANQRVNGAYSMHITSLFTIIAHE